MHRVHKGLALFQVMLLGLTFLPGASHRGETLKVTALEAESIVVGTPDSPGRVAIVATKVGTGIWVTDRKAVGGNRFVGLTVTGLGPAVEMQSGKPHLLADDFAVSFDASDDTPVVQIAGKDGNLHFLDADQLVAKGDRKPKPRMPPPR